MTASRRRRPYAAVCGGRSQAAWKATGNRAFRRLARVLTLGADPEAVFPLLREVMNVYDAPQDGSRGYRPFNQSQLAYRDWYRWTLSK